MLIEDRVLLWKNNPDKFVEDIFNVKLEKWQREFLLSFLTNDKIAVKSGHGTGKSAALSWLILWYLTTNTPARIVVTAPTAAQLFTILWAEVSIWLRRSKYNFKSLFKITEDSINLIGAEKENFCVARTARKDNPESIQGQHAENTLIIVDEASGVPQIIFETIEGSLSTAGSRIVMTSNPTRTSGFFYDAFHKNRSLWKCMSVSCFDSSRVDPSYIKNILTSYGKESNVYKVRVDGSFPDSSDDAVISLKLMEDAVNRGIEPFGEIVWGVDVARFGSDRSALAKRQGAKLLEPVKSWSQRDTMETAGLIKSEYDSCEDGKKPYKIMVDVIGLGAGVVDRLKELGLPVVGVNVAEGRSYNKKFSRLRDELWWKGREWFESRICDIPDDNTLIGELSGPIYKLLSNGTIQVESKESMKERGLESPDCADAFLLTFSDEKPKIIRKRENNYQPRTSWMA